MREEKQFCTFRTYFAKSERFSENYVRFNSSRLKYFHHCVADRILIQYDSVFFAEDDWFTPGKFLQ